MPTFAYVARDSSGKRVEGQISAESSQSAARALRDEGKTVVSVTRGKAAAAISIKSSATASQMPAAAAAPRSSIFAARVKSEEIRAFAQSMSVMMNTGVSLTEALETCEDPRNTPQFAAVMRDLIAQVKSGSTFSAALARHRRVFSPLFINMVKASEASGQLGRMLHRVAGFLAGQQEMSRKIKGALTYPAVMIVLAGGVLIFMVTFVLPKFAKIYAGREDALPAITRLLMVGSDWMIKYGPYAGGLGLIGGVAGIMYLRGDAGRPLGDRMKLGVPLLGKLFHQTYLARSLRTLGTLLQSGVSFLESVELTRDAVGNVVYAQLWEQVHASLQSGQQLSASLGDHRLIPRAVAKMLEAGERGGRLGEVMDAVATHCEEEVAARIKQVTSLIEPAIVMFVGSIVGTIVLALLLPIFTISKALKPH